MTALLHRPKTAPAVGSHSILPGLALTAAAVAVGFGVHTWIDAVSPLVVGVALGAVVANTVGIGERLMPGVRFAAKRLLRVGVVLLGFQLSLGQLRTLGGPGLGVVALTVAVTFFGTRWAGRRLGLSDAMSLLVATGYSICGASAIAAVEDIAGADEEEVAFSIALVTLCGTLSILVLPALADVLGLHGAAFGSWVGASVHDVGQVVAAATPGGSLAVQTAVIVKLTRVVLLAPLVAGLSIARRRRERQACAGVAAETPTNTPSGTTVHRRPPMIPLFVVGFLAAVAVRSSGIVPAATLTAIKDVQAALLAAALFGLGCGVSVARLRRVGGRPLVLGLISWVLVAGVALAATRVLPR
ncbi:MAG: hypothetical protein JWN62_1284 [Acidimicrobiales bacterium]|nr:hypothetical protein [Acidimicrobiales bacterium]